MDLCEAEDDNMKAKYWFLTLIIGFLVSFGSASAAVGVQEIDDFTRANQNPGWGNASGGDVVWTCNGASNQISSNQGLVSGRNNDGQCFNSVNTLGNTSILQLSYGVKTGQVCSGGDTTCDMSLSFWDNSTGNMDLITTWIIDGANHYTGQWGSGVGFGSIANTGSYNTWEIDFDVALQKVRITDTNSLLTSGYVNSENLFTDVTTISFNRMHTGGANGDLSINDIQMEYFYTPGGGGGAIPNGSNSLTGLPNGYAADLEFNTTTGQWNYNWTDSVGTLNNTDLEVWVYNNNQYFQIGINTSASNSSSMRLDTYTAYENQTTRAFAYLTDYNRTFVGGASKILLLSGIHYAPSIINSSTYTIDEPEGVFWAMILVGSMVMISSYNPPVAVMMGVSGLFLTSYMGFFAISQGVLMLISLMAGILVWRLKR
jgi:hypothetical protein